MGKYMLNISKFSGSLGEAFAEIEASEILSSF